MRLWRSLWLSWKRAAVNMLLLRGECSRVGDILWLLALLCGWVTDEVWPAHLKQLMLCQQANLMQPRQTSTHCTCACFTYWACHEQRLTLTSQFHSKRVPEATITHALYEVPELLHFTALRVAISTLPVDHTISDRTHNAEGTDQTNKPGHTCPLRWLNGVSCLFSPFSVNL